MVKIETIPHADGDVWYSVCGNCDDSPHDGRFRFYILCSYLIYKLDFQVFIR